MDDEGGRVLVREVWPEITGRPGLTQGRYGATGDLKLAVAGSLQTQDSRTLTVEEHRDR
jgi:hypothetical protein